MEDLVIDLDCLFPTEEEVSNLLKKIESGEDLTFDEILILKKIKLVEQIIKFKKTKI